MQEGLAFEGVARLCLATQSKACLSCSTSRVWKISLTAQSKTGSFYTQPHPFRHKLGGAGGSAAVPLTIKDVFLYNFLHVVLAQLHSLRHKPSGAGGSAAVPLTNHPATSTAKSHCENPRTYNCCEPQNMDAGTHPQSPLHPQAWSQPSACTRLFCPST